MGRKMNSTLIALVSFGLGTAVKSCQYANKVKDDSKVVYATRNSDDTIDVKTNQLTRFGTLLWTRNTHLKNDGKGKYVPEAESDWHWTIDSDHRMDIYGNWK